MKDKTQKTGEDLEMEGKLDETKGKIKEGVGKLGGDRSTEWSGKAEQAKGKVKQGIGEVKEEVDELDKP
jgi:uncharacterized protein YjbJ (UPF0337 family)